MSNNFFQRESLCSGTLSASDVTCTLTFNIKNTTFSIFLTYSNRPLCLLLIKSMFSNPNPYVTLPSLVFTPLRYITPKKVPNSYDDNSYNCLTSALYIYLNICSPNPIIQWKYYKDVFKVNMNWTLLYHFWDTTLWVDPSPPVSHFITFLVELSPL